MKRLTLFMCVVMLISMLPFASFATDEKKQPDESRGFSDMPNDWSKIALQSAVDNKLLVGSNGKLMPNGQLTRAEMAAIITRAFKASKKGDITRFTDVKATDWFFEYLAISYQMGIIKGTNGFMKPNDAITREEVFAVITRAFKLKPADKINKTFSDLNEISDWAKGEVYALVNAGYVQGAYGKLNPKGLISRAEFSQVMYNIIKQYISEPGEATIELDGNVMVNVTGVNLKNTTVKGDLIVSDGVGDGDIILDNVIVTGRMVVRGGGVDSIIIRGSSDIANIVVSRIDGAVCIKVQEDANVEVIYIDDGSDDVNIEGTVGNVEINGSDITVNADRASIGQIDVLSRNCRLNIDEGSSINKINIQDNGANTIIAVEGTVSNITTKATRTIVTGTGSVTKVEVQSSASNARIETPSTEITVAETVFGVTGGGRKQITPGTTETNNASGDDIIGEPEEDIPSPEEDIPSNGEMPPTNGDTPAYIYTPGVVSVSGISITTDPIYIDGLYNDVQVEVSLTTVTDGAEIYFTTDISAPIADFTKYTEPFIITAPEEEGGTVTVRALGKKDGHTSSSVATKIIEFTGVKSPEEKPVAFHIVMEDSDESNISFVLFEIYRAGPESGPTPKNIPDIMDSDFTLFKVDEETEIDGIRFGEDEEKGYYISLPDSETFEEGKYRLIFSKEGYGVVDEFFDFEDGKVTIKVSSIDVTPEMVVLKNGEKSTIETIVSPVNAIDKTITWTTSDEKVATVGTNGEVTAVKAGMATITATAGDKTATCIVCVESLVEDFNFNTSTKTITEYIGSGGDVVIPSTIENVPVEHIGDIAFIGCKTLTNIMIPNSVISIGNQAFFECENLENAIFQDASRVTDIGGSAFDSCPALTDFIIPNSVISIGGYAFYGCYSLIDIIIPNSVESMGEGMFYGCENLESVTFQDTPQVDAIEVNSFYGCYSLTEITIPNSVIYIGTQAFESCENLESVIFQDASQLTNIDGLAFALCYSLKDITIPNSVISIGRYAFCDCENLESVTFQEESQVTTIGVRAFAYCYNLTSITIPDSVTSIGDSAFSDCGNLTRITIGDNVEIGDELLGENDNDFQYAYSVWGAGEYVLQGNVWVHSEDNDPQEDLNDVDVVEYGAKDFVEPVECDINGTNVITAKDSIYNLSVGDTVRIINGKKAESTGIAGEDLIAKIIDIDGKSIVIDSTCGSTITTKMYIDSTQAFKNAFNHANRNNCDILIPEGNYFVDSDIIVQTNVICRGKIYTSNKGRNSLFYITRKEQAIQIKGNNIAGSLESGTNYIPELAEYADHDVLFNSQERIMWRNNNPGDFYDKNETNRINNDGFLTVGLAESYEEKSLLSIRLYKKESPIILEGLNILCIDDDSIGNGKYIVMLRRSDVTLNNFTLENQNISKEKGQSTGIGIVDAVDVTFNDCKIKGFMLNGLGYGVLVNNTLNLTLNNVDVSKTRHAIAGRHDNYTIIDGGSYESYGGTIDSHWGHNCTVKNATVYGYNAFSYNGNNFTVSNCTAISDGPLLVYRREDCPTLKGTVEIKDTKVIYMGSSNFVFYRSFLTDFEHDAELYNPNLLIIENVELALKKDIGIVDKCVIDNKIDKQYTMQGLPENIRVNNLYITGENDTKLKNTRFRMLAATSKYYTGNTNVSLENIRINRDTDSSGSLNYDGEIAYSFNPNHTEAEVPDTHYKMTVKDCGTLSINIIPTILGDMVIENCNIRDYIYSGNLVNDWPNNPIWWYKGTGKTIFRDVKFDRTGLPASTISIMNDAEFERCEFINYGTIDYMDFGDELPTVQILKVEDCVFNEGGITGGNLSKFLPDISITTDPTYVSGLYSDVQVEVSLTTMIDGAEIYFTTDISAPIADFTKYTGPFVITAPGEEGGTVTVRALGIKDGHTSSSIIATKIIEFTGVKRPEERPVAFHIVTEDSDESNLSFVLFEIYRVGPESEPAPKNIPDIMDSDFILVKVDEETEIDGIKFGEDEEKGYYISLPDSETFEEGKYRLIFNKEGYGVVDEIFDFEDGNVTIKVSSIDVTPETLVLKKGEESTIEAIVSPFNATDKTVTWTTSDEKVVTVSTNGEVTAVKTGTATITATAGDKTATCMVCVESLVEFNFNASTKTITEYIGSGGDVVIPSTIEDVPVEHIGYFAFTGCQTLTNITIPNSVYQHR